MREGKGKIAIERLIPFECIFLDSFGSQMVMVYTSPKYYTNVTK